METVKANPSLQNKLKAACDANAIVSIAKSLGFTISPDELRMAQEAPSDDELEDPCVSCTTASMCADTD